jgi:hypothetical protein
LEGAEESSVELEESAPGDTEVELDVPLEGLSLGAVCAAKGGMKTDEHNAVMKRNSEREFTLPRRTK